MDFILLHWHCILPVLLILYVLLPKKSDGGDTTKEEIK